MTRGVLSCCYDRESDDYNNEELCSGCCLMAPPRDSDSDEVDRDKIKFRAIAKSICIARLLFWFNALFLIFGVSIPLMYGSVSLLSAMGWSSVEFTATHLTGAGAFAIGFLNALAIANRYLPSSHNMVMWINLVYFAYTGIVLLISVIQLHHPNSNGLIGALIFCIAETVVCMGVASSLSNINEQELKEFRSGQ